MSQISFKFYSEILFNYTSVSIKAEIRKIKDYKHSQKIKKNQLIKTSLPFLRGGLPLGSSWFCLPSFTAMAVGRFAH